ncbi:putative glycosyl [Golovinomyces cichoracearum]|uniref:Putative glycosyl n=1 Tax=Golovinomyces cichoracearum TaxID=62708 RepID=A0A420JAU7_9PEZI|nr:putative glycosyl [Golovinomyces cichoracearum]
MRDNFEGPEYHRYNLQKWKSLTFQSIINQNPDKNGMEQVTILINKLDKMQKTLSPEFRTNEALYSKIITACKCVEACKMACYRPSPTVPGLIRDLRSRIEVFDKPLPKSVISSHHQQRDPTLTIDNTYFTDRKYHGGSNAKTHSFKPGQRPKINRCWICKEGCWSGKHPRSERDENNRKFLNNLNRRAEQYISEFEGEHEIEFEDDVEMQALFEELD